MAFSPEAAFEFLGRAHRSGRLAHAYLITGEPGSGKRTLALRLAGLVAEAGANGLAGFAGLAEPGEGTGAEALKLPDVHTVEPESKSRLIRVEQTRELEKALQMRSSQGGRKVGILFDAERMNAAFFPNAREYSRQWGLDDERVSRLPADTMVMHPGPMNRGLEISAGAADSARSTVLEQVANGVSIRMAVLYHLLSGTDS